MPERIHRIHIPCPNCGFCNHIFTGEKLPDKAPADDDLNVDDYGIDKPHISDLDQLSQIALVCANCSTKLSFGFEIRVIMYTEEPEQNDNMSINALVNAPIPDKIQ